MKLKNDTDLRPTDEDLSWIASLHDMGRTCGTLFPAILLDKIGRMYTIVICSAIFFLTWLATIFANSVPLICLLRFSLGLAQGLQDVTSTIYIAENCSPHLRAIIGSVGFLIGNVGQILEYTIAAYVSYQMNNVVITCIALSAFSVSFFLKETPYWLVVKGQDAAAERNLVWLRGNSVSDSEVKQELVKIQEYIQSEKLKKTSVMTLLTDEQNYKSIISVIILYTLYVATGKTAIVAYASMIYQPSAIFSVNQFTIFLGAFLLLAAIISPFIVERWDRRILILTSLLIMATCHICTILLYWIHPRWDAYPWLLFASTTSYVTLYAMTYPAVFMTRSELLPMSVRAVGGSASILTSSLISFAVIRSFSPLTVYSIQYNFVLYLSACILTFIFVYLILPETRGKSLTDIKL